MNFFFVCVLVVIVVVVVVVVFSQYKSFRFSFGHIWLKVGLSSLSSLCVLTEKAFKIPLEQWIRSLITSLSTLNYIDVWLRSHGL